MTDITMKDYVDAQTQATRSQNDARFAEVISELRTLDSKLSHLPSVLTVWAAVFTGVASILGVVLGVLAFGGDRFDGGVQVATTGVEFLQDVRAATSQNAEQIRTLSEQMAKRDAELQRLIESLERGRPQTLPQLDLQTPDPQN